MRGTVKEIALVVHNVRSCHNVGSLLRTCDGLGVSRVYLTGYTPYPRQDDDTRLPHIARKIDAMIRKTALGAEDSVAWSPVPDITGLLRKLNDQGFELIALEQDSRAVPLPDFHPKERIAIIVGREVEGIEKEILDYVDVIVEIPISGLKESYNVSIAGAIALYQCKYLSA